MDTTVSLEDHIVDFDNPHGDTKETVKLEKVDNLRVATNAEASAQSAPEEVYVTPMHVRLYFDAELKKNGLMDRLGHVILR